MAVEIKKLSILIPVYNEMRTLRRLLDAVLTAPLPCPRELVIVDDGSSDGSAEILHEYAGKYKQIVLLHHAANQGKGAAVRAAIGAMTGDWAVIQDADLEYNPDEIKELLVPATEGIADAVFGSRFLTGRYRRAMFFWHNLASKAMTITCNLLCDLNLTDIGTCYKLVRSDILKSMVLKSNGFALDAELTTKLSRWGARIYEVPISYRGRSYAEGKKVRPRDALALLGAMLKYRFFDLNYSDHEGFLILQAVRRARRFNRWLFSTFADTIGDNVLEAGCGIGNLTEFLLDRRRLVCIDQEAFYLDRLQNAYGHLANIQFHQADLTRREDLEHASAGRKFDTIICINVLEHIADDEGVLSLFGEFLEPGGRLIILVPHDPALYSEVDRILGHCRRYTREGLEQKLAARGYSVERCLGFNRVGGLGWRISGKLFRKKSLSTGQMTLFELMMP